MGGNRGTGKRGNIVCMGSECNIINVRGHVRVNVTAGRGDPRTPQEATQSGNCNLRDPTVPVAALEIIVAEHRSQPQRGVNFMPKFIPKQDATVNATAATANETDNCEVCLVAQREPRLALVP